MKKDWNPIIAIILFAVTYFLLTHVPQLKVLAFVTLAPLFYILLKYKPKKSFIYLLIGSLITYSISFTWLIRFNFIIFLLGGFSFIFPIILLFLANLLYENFSKKDNFLLKIIFLSLLWIIIFLVLEMIGGTLPLWMNFSIFTPLSTPLVWLIKMEGITFLIILFNFLLVGLFRKGKNQKKIIYSLLAIIGLAFIFCFIFSSYYETEKDFGGLKIAAVQANIFKNIVERYNDSDGVFQEYKDITLNINESVDIIIWPEYSILKNVAEDEEFLDELLALSNEINTTLILGAPSFIDDGLNFTYDEKTIRGRKDLPIKLYNTALVVNPEKDNIEMTYAEEIFPIDKYALAYEENNRILTYKNINFGLILCWEERKLQIPKKVAGENPDLIISLINDPLLDYSSGAYVSSLFSRIHAAESRKYWVRVSNTGITQIINPQGRVIKSLPEGERNILIHEFS